MADEKTQKTQKTEAGAPVESAPPERARFLVTEGPGAYIHGVGFVKPGESFVAPEDYTPAYHMRPMNKAAQVALEKLQARIAEHQAKPKKPAPASSEYPMDTSIVAPKASEPTVRREEGLDQLRKEGGERAADR